VKILEKQVLCFPGSILIKFPQCRQQDVDAFNESGILRDPNFHEQLRKAFGQRHTLTAGLCFPVSGAIISNHQTPRLLPKLDSLFVPVGGMNVQRGFALNSHLLHILRFRGLKKSNVSWFCTNGSSFRYDDLFFPEAPEKHKTIKQLYDGFLRNSSDFNDVNGTYYFQQAKSGFFLFSPFTDQLDIMRTTLQQLLTPIPDELPPVERENVWRISGVLDLDCGPRNPKYLDIRNCSLTKHDAARLLQQKPDAISLVHCTGLSLATLKSLLRSRLIWLRVYDCGLDEDLWKLLREYPQKLILVPEGVHFNRLLPNAKLCVEQKYEIFMVYCMASASLAGN